MPGVRMKRSAVRRKARRALVRRRPRRLGRVGNLTLTRKCAEQNVYNTGATAVAAASGSVVVIGTPYQTPAFVGSTFYNIPFSIDTQLADLLNHTELTAIADKYKINWVKVKIYATSNTASAGSISQLPSILWSLDEDDAAIPASSTAGLNSIREKMACKYRQFKQNGGGISIFYKPKIANTVAAAGGGTVNAGVSSAKWLDTVNDTVSHFGVKGYLQDVNLASTASAYTQFKFDISMSVSVKDIQ